jgi:hypothetical protein
VEAVGFGPAQTEADAQAAHFRGGVDCTRIFSNVEAGNADFASDANYAHQGVEYGGRSLVLHAGMAVTASFEAYGVNSAAICSCSGVSVDRSAISKPWALA